MMNRNKLVFKFHVDNFQCGVHMRTARARLSVLQALLKAIDKVTRETVQQGATFAFQGHANSPVIVVAVPRTATEAVCMFFHHTGQVSTSSVAKVSNVVMTIVEDLVRVPSNHEGLCGFGYLKGNGRRKKQRWLMCARGSKQIGNEPTQMLMR